MEKRESISDQKLVTQNQYETLELFITNSQHATIRAKKAILYFLRRSNFLQKNIAMTIPYLKDGTDECLFAYEVSYAVHDMCANQLSGITLCNVFDLIGCKSYLGQHGGVAKKVNSNLIAFETAYNIGEKEMRPNDYMGNTIWLSEKPYSKNVELIEFRLNGVQATCLRKNLSHQSNQNFWNEFYKDEDIPTRFYTFGKRERY